MWVIIGPVLTPLSRTLGPSTVGGSPTQHYKKAHHNDFNLCYNLMKKSSFECTMTYKKFVRQFQILQKNNSKIQILKLLKDQQILKNQMIHCLKIIETKQNI